MVCIHCQQSIHIPIGLHTLARWPERWRTYSERHRRVASIAIAIITTAIVDVGEIDGVDIDNVEVRREDRSKGQAH